MSKEMNMIQKQLKQDFKAGKICVERNDYKTVLVRY